MCSYILIKNWRICLTQRGPGDYLHARGEAWQASHCMHDHTIHSDSMIAVPTAKYIPARHMVHTYAGRCILYSDGCESGSNWHSHAHIVLVANMFLRCLDRCDHDLYTLISCTPLHVHSTTSRVIHNKLYLCWADCIKSECIESSLRFMKELARLSLFLAVVAMIKLKIWSQIILYNNYIQDNRYAPR